MNIKKKVNELYEPVTHGCSGRYLGTEKQPPPPADTLSGIQQKLEMR